MPSPATCASTVPASCRCLLLAPAPGFPLRLLHRNASLFLHGGKHHRGVRPGDARDAPQGIADEPIERFGIPRHDFEEIGIEPRHAVTLEHFGQLQDPARERLVVARMGIAHAYEGANVVAHRPRVESGDVPEDGSRVLQLAHAVGDRRLGQTYLGGDVHLRRLRVGLEEIQDLMIYRVERHRAGLLSEKDPSVAWKIDRRAESGNQAPAARPPTHDSSAWASVAWGSSPRKTRRRDFAWRHATCALVNGGPSHAK